MARSVSVVIPTYNRLHTLDRCLRSVLDQSHPADEIIVVDDGSTDGSADWIRYQHPNVQLIQQANRGVSAARNAGIQAAKSDWIALLDSDDEWLLKKIEKQLAAIDRSPETRLCHTEENWVYQGTPKAMPAAYRKYGGWIFEHCLPRCAISPSTALIHRELFDGVGLFNESLPACEDYDLWLRVCSRYPVTLVDAPLIAKHGGHEDQLSNQRGLDVYRIQSLDKLLRDDSLKTDYRSMAIETLTTKCNIVANAAEKRGNEEDAKRFREIASRHQP